MGAIFTEAVIQQLADIDHNMLRVLKDFAHLLRDDSERQPDGSYHWDVPQAKLAAMSNLNPRTVRKNLKKLAAKRILVRVKKGSYFNEQASEYALNLPKNFNREEILCNYGKIFAGQTYQAAVERILKGNRRGEVLVEMAEADFSQPVLPPQAEIISPQSATIAPKGEEKSSTQEEKSSAQTEKSSAHQHKEQILEHSTPTSIDNSSKEERKDGQEGSVKRISIKGIFDDEDNQHLSVDVLVSRACAICRDFNGAALRNLHIPTACLPYVRDAIDMFAKMPKESITNHAKYLYSMCKNAAQGKAPIPNDKIVEEVGQLECERQNKISHVLERFGLDNKSIATAGEEGSKARRSISLLVERINRIVDKASLDDLDAICNEAIAAMQKMPGAESYTVNMRATVLASQFSIISGHKYPQNA